MKIMVFNDLNRKIDKSTWFIIEKFDAQNSALNFYKQRAMCVLRVTNDMCICNTVLTKILFLHFVCIKGKI